MTSNQNPITDAASTVYNAYLDEAEFDQRKARLAEGSTYYPGPSSDDVFSIMQHEICLAKRIQPYSQSKGWPSVFSTVNGLGTSTQTHWELIASLKFGGVSKNASKYDSTGNKNDQMVVTQFGGLQSTTDTGPFTITNGDDCMWDLPDVKNPFAMPGPRNSDRMPIWVVPYKHGFEGLTKNALYDIIFNGVPETTDKYRLTNLIDSATLYIQSVKTMFLLAFHAFASIGLIDTETMITDLYNTTGGGFFESKSMKERARSYATNENRDDLFRVLGRNLLLTPGDDGDGFTGYTQNIMLEKKGVSYFTREGEEKKSSLKDLLCHVFLGTNRDLLIIPYEEGTMNIPSGWKGNLCNRQVNLYADMFNSIIRADMDKRSRIFGRANSSARPGEKFDITLKQ
jgi:hypothetical protein